MTSIISHDPCTIFPGIDGQVANHTNKIKSKFKEIHDLLDKRESVLISNLNKIANDKKQELENISNTLKQDKIRAQQKLKECSIFVTKPTELHEIETRIERISQIAKQVNDTKIISKDDSIISNNTINVKFNNDLINKNINSIGNVFIDIIPIIISLSDNKDCTIAVKWKLDGYIDDHKHNKKLSISWNETKSDDIEEFEENKWQNTKEIHLNNNKNEDSINIPIDNQITSYSFAIKYFNGNQWSQFSKTKCISITEIVNLTDSWDEHFKANYLEIDDKSIINTADGYEYGSAYLKRVVYDGIHKWKFRIDKYRSGWQLIGVFKTKYNAITQTYFERNQNQSYGFVLNNGWLSDPQTNGGKLKDYGVKCVDGDIVEMTLNMIDLCLSFKINDIDYGKAFDVEQTSYKAAVTLRNKDTKFTLLSYQNSAHKGKYV